jgi:hypothetical protein
LQISDEFGPTTKLPTAKPSEIRCFLVVAVAHQPVTVAIEAGGRQFQLYESVS